ncbi:hypothetical protein I545_6760 [Mycobacterium kansasii 662]|uniref:Uncharacterized protein n=1 Tax=Mycobacterium kansasii 662 TaxID=1299326 RepID=X7XW40_MYCKA|nr:hypothetical protein I545_6760 [Mycobacterium kansasii 662]
MCQQLGIGQSGPLEDGHDTAGSLERRAATTDPALPAPTINTSLCPVAAVKAAVMPEFAV